MAKARHSHVLLNELINLSYIVPDIRFKRDRPVEFTLPVLFVLLGLKFDSGLSYRNFVASVAFNPYLLERLDRMHTWFLHELGCHNSTSYEVKQRLGEVWARAIIDIVGTQNEEKDAQRAKARYISALEILRINGHISSYPWADALTESDLSDLKKLIAAEISWNDILQYYGRFLRDLAYVFNGIQDDTMKVEWTNAVVETGWSLPVELQKAFFMFANVYDGNAIQDSAYELFTKNHDLPFENVSELVIDRFVSMVRKSDEDAQNAAILNTLAWLLQRNDIKPDVKKRIIHHAEKCSSMGSWMDSYLGAGWKRKALL